MAKELAGWTNIDTEVDSIMLSADDEFVYMKFNKSRVRVKLMPKRAFNVGEWLMIGAKLANKADMDEFRVHKGETYPLPSMSELN